MTVRQRRVRKRWATLFSNEFCDTTSTVSYVIFFVHTVVTLISVFSANAVRQRFRLVDRLEIESSPRPRSNALTPAERAPQKHFARGHEAPGRTFPVNTLRSQKSSRNPPSDDTGTDILSVPLHPSTIAVVERVRLRPAPLTTLIGRFYGHTVYK